MTMPSLNTALAAAAAAFAMLWAAPALAQSQPPQQQQQIQISEDDLQSYAAAALEVRRISEDYQTRLQAAPDEAAQAKLQQEAQAEMIKAVDEEGLTVQQYNEIYQMAQADPQVRQQIQAYMQEAR